MFTQSWPFEPVTISSLKKPMWWQHCLYTYTLYDSLLQRNLIEYCDYLILGMIPYRWKRVTSRSSISFHLFTMIRLKNLFLIGISTQSEQDKYTYFFSFSLNNSGLVFILHLQRQSVENPNTYRFCGLFFNNGCSQKKKTTRFLEALMLWK